MNGVDWGAIQALAQRADSTEAVTLYTTFTRDGQQAIIEGAMATAAGQVVAGEARERNYFDASVTSADFDMSFLAYLIPGITDLRGKLGADLRFSGTPDYVVPSGGILVEDVASPWTTSRRATSWDSQFVSVNERRLGRDRPQDSRPVRQRGYFGRGAHARGHERLGTRRELAHAAPPGPQHCQARQSDLLRLGLHVGQGGLPGALQPDRHRDRGHHPQGHPYRLPRERDDGRVRAALHPLPPARGHPPADAGELFARARPRHGLARDARGRAPARLRRDRRGHHARPGRRRHRRSTSSARALTRCSGTSTWTRATTSSRS